MHASQAPLRFAHMGLSWENLVIILSFLSHPKWAIPLLQHSYPKVLHHVYLPLYTHKLLQCLWKYCHQLMLLQQPHLGTLFNLRTLTEPAVPVAPLCTAAPCSSCSPAVHCCFCLPRLLPQHWNGTVLWNGTAELPLLLLIYPTLILPRSTPFLPVEAHL